MRLRFLLPLIALYFSYSCQTPTEMYLSERTWIVEEMTYKNEDIIPYLLTHTFHFYKSKKCHIPYSDKGDGFIYKDEYQGKWSVTRNNKLKINSLRDYINGEFDFCFEKDKNGKEYLIITSEDLYVKARRGNFGGNTKMPFTCRNDV